MTHTTSEIFLKARMTEPHAISLGGGTAVVFSASGKEDPDAANQDSAVLVSLSDGRAVLVVADGAGGQPAGDQASALAAQCVERACALAEDTGLSLRDAILNGFEEANRAILALGVGAATTLAVAEIDGDTLRPYHAGDSGVVVTGQRGRTKLATMAHSPVGYAVEAGFLDTGDAMHHEERHVVSNLLGQNDMRIELGSALPLSVLDTVVLASDGLFDNLTAPEIIDLVRSGDLLRAARLLRDAAMGRMQTQEAGVPSKPDDLTFVLYRRDRRHKTP